LVDLVSGRHIDRRQYVACEVSAVDVKTIEACCEPLLSGALTEAQAEDLAAAFKVLSDPARLRLLSIVANSSAGEACACDLVEPVGR